MQRAQNNQWRKKRLVRLCAGIALLPFLFSGNDGPDQLEQVERRGSLTMITRNGPSSYYLGPDGATGPEFYLVSRFAEYIGVRLKVEVAESFNALQELLDQGKGDLIAANMTRTRQRERAFNFGPDYLQASTQVLYRRGDQRPASLADLVDRKIMVIEGSSYQSRLEEAQPRYPDLSWETRADVGMDDLLQAVSDGAIDITLADSNIFSLNQQYYPRAAAAFTLGDPSSHAWAFPPGSDDSLVEKARAFMRQSREDGALDDIQKRFYSPQRRLDRVGMFQFLEHLRERLPPLLPIFRQAAVTHEVDWRLLAAMGYQESNWDAGAASFTGVRGIMMLTNRAASDLGVTDRLDPQQSIAGGARYFQGLRSRIPRRIAEPDRTWMALAAYNMGMGHLEDARVLTEIQQLDPNAWQDVQSSLDLLSQERWHQQTQYGYARGFEAKQYVSNIRNYYDVLVWMDTSDHPLLAPAGAR